MIRRIINIDEEKCNGCGLCAEACHEGAIGMIEGKARLLRDDYCDGLGDCLPACPTGAITFVEREAAAYDEKAVMKNKTAKNNSADKPLPCGCPGTQSKTLERKAENSPEKTVHSSELRQWPVQIKLAPVNAPYFSGANLLIAADCTAYAYADFHKDFIRNKITLIGCPKLDNTEYSEKLTEIIKKQRYQQRYGSAYGGTVLRRNRVRCKKRSTGERKVYTVEYSYNIHRWKNIGLIVISKTVNTSAVILSV